jgi:hypothetical protein
MTNRVRINKAITLPATAKDIIGATTIFSQIKVKRGNPDKKRDDTTGAHRKRFPP